MRETGKLYWQAVAIAGMLLEDPKHTAMLVYAKEPTAERVRVYLREIASNFPGMEDWEQRVKFQNVNDKPKLETLPKITVDEWVDMPVIPHELLSANERLNRMCDLLSGADPEIFKRAKEKHNA
jgi:hypothetical protein